MLLKKFSFGIFITSLLISAELLTSGRGNAATLSDNLSVATAYTELISGNMRITSDFATGSSVYTLSSVTLLMMSNTPGPVNLSLYSNAGSTPGSLVGSLTNPGSFSSGSLSPTVFNGNLTLSALTRYWVVLSASGAGAYEWAYAADNSGSGIGFTHNWGVSTNAGLTWSTFNLQPMQMRVEAVEASSPIPEPSDLALVVAGAVVLCFRKRVAASGWKNYSSPLKPTI